MAVWAKVRLVAASPGSPGDHRYWTMPRRQRRRMVLWAMAQVFLNAAALLALYYLLPFQGQLDGATALWLLGGLVVLCAVLMLQVRQILRARYPRVRAVQALAFSLPLFLLVFAATYVLLAQSNPSSFNEPLSRTDALYFTVTVFSTVGFGDIVPVSESARVVVMVQMLGGVVLVGVVAKVFLGAVTAGLQRRSTETPAADGDPRSEPSSRR